MENKLQKGERINGKESSNIILFSDDYDGMDNSEFNTKVCMLTFWTSYLYFPGGELPDKKISFEENIIDYVKKLFDFDISEYKDKFIHISSKFIDEGHTLHTYALQISKMEMAKLKIKEIDFDQNENPSEDSLILTEICGLNKFNISRATIDFVMRSNFGPGVKEDLEKFVDIYIKNKMKREQDFIEQIKRKMEMDVISKTINQDPDNFKKELFSFLEKSGYGYILNPDDPRTKKMLNPDGTLNDELLKKLFQNDLEKQIFGGNNPNDVKNKSNATFDFRQKSW